MSLHDVLSDYRSSIESGIADFDVQLAFSALRVSGSYVNQHPDALAFDLLGRLLVYYDKNIGVRNLLQQCDVHGLRHSSVLPLYQCFESPRAMLLYVLEDHMQVSCVVTESLSLALCNVVTTYFILASSLDLNIIFTLSL